MKKRLIVILGPTAVGKSAVAVRLAKKCNGEVVSADSRQVYKGLDIGTGKITEKEMRGVPHYLLDVADSKKWFSVVEYQKLAREKIREIFSRGRVPIVCGGTGFYIQSIVDGIVLPEVPPNKALRTRLEKKTVMQLFVILKKLDTRRTKTIDRNNPRRLVRAIEIATALGKVPLYSNVPQNIGIELLNIGLNVPPEELKRRIHGRLAKRISSGMVSEARQLHKNGLSWKRMNELGLEYRFLALYLQKKISKEELREKLQAEIWQYAKRQMTWFKRDKRIMWFKPSQFSEISTLAKKFLARD